MVKTTSPKDEIRVVHSIVLAFAADPVARWVWPGSHQYLSAMPSFVRAFCGGAFSTASAYFVEGHVGAALWLPPGVHSDDAALEEIIENSVQPAIQGELNSVLEQMAGFHPDEPHWYLPMIGVDPAHQGAGYGSALMKHALERCDRDGLPAYLESTNPRNISLYKRHGFVEIGVIQAGSSPPMTPMLRKAR